MEYRTLGRTGLKVSVMGIGGGGPSRLGQRGGNSEAESIAIIQQALAAGVNFIDTAEGYQTEEIVGRAIAEIPRDGVIISTKKSIKPGMTAQDVRHSLAAALQRLQTDYVDIYHLHGIKLADYDWLLNDIVPMLEQLRTEGQIRFIGVTELFNSDLTHTMLQRALQDNVWDVMMVGFNILNQTARERVFVQTIAQEIGVLVMFAVRLAFSRPERIAEVIAGLLENGQLDPNEIDPQDPFGFLLTTGGATSLTDAAYRFCRDEPGTHVILSGTGNPDHLRANIESLSRPPLPAEVSARLRHIFRRVNSVSGQ